MKYSLLITMGLAVCGVAYGQATYEVTFDSQWSAATHPGAYPSAAHFSPLIGGTHNDSVSYWEPGGIASNAIEQMAETGGTTQLRNIILGDISNGSAAEVIRTSTMFAPGFHDTTFNVSAAHPLLTLVTMIAPSPDWFVGVSSLDFRQNGQWIESLSIDLENYDAGTDAGLNFSSPNSDVTPHEPISVLGAPLAGLPPIGTFTFELIDSTVPICDFDASGACDIGDLDALLGMGPILSGVNVEYGTNDTFDINGDGVINLDDRDEWLAGAAAENGLASAYSPADADLNGFTDGLDFVVWNDNKFTTSLAASAGDFNGDGVVDGLDFVVWNEFKFTAADVAAVPEPAGWCLLTVACLLCSAVRRSLAAH